MPFANFAVQSIGVQNVSMAHLPLQYSLVVVIMARLLSTHYQNHHLPSVPFLKTKHPKHGTFKVTLDSTIAHLHSHPSMLMPTMLIFMVAVLGRGKQVTRLITLLEPFTLLLVSVHHMHNCIFMMHLTLLIFAKSGTQTFAVNSSMTFKRL